MTMKDYKEHRSCERKMHLNHEPNFDPDANLNYKPSVCVAWRKALRRVWRLSPRTHCNTIYLLSDCEPMEIIIQRIFINFANSTQNNVVLSTIMLRRTILFLHLGVTM